MDNKPVMIDGEIMHREAVCPHCGYVFTDSWELPVGDENPYEEGDGSVECSGCDREFRVSRKIDVYYVSKPLRDPPKEDE